MKPSSPYLVDNYVGLHSSAPAYGDTDFITPTLGVKSWIRVFVGQIFYDD